MKRQYDVLHAIILLAFLLLAGFIPNAVIRGLMLLLFSTVLTINTAFKLKSKLKEKLSDKLFYGVLLFLDLLLFLGAMVVIISAIAGKGLSN